MTADERIEALILRVLERGGEQTGVRVMQATGFSSGTIYPALMRLENSGKILSRWESDEPIVYGYRRRLYRVPA